MRPLAATCLATSNSRILIRESATWPTKQTRGRSLQHMSLFSEGEPNVTEKILILASRRTARRDPFDQFHIYHGGWNISNEHYWSSVGVTGGPGFVLAAVWLAVGLGNLLLLCCCCCCCRERLKGAHKGGNLFSLLCLICFTGAAMAGCVFVYTGQQKFHDELSDTLDYVVQESEIVVKQLRNISTVLVETQTIDVLNFALPDSDMAKVRQLNAQLAVDANHLETETNENAQKIQNGLNNVRLAMVVVAGVMLLLVLLGFLFLLLGIGPLVYMLVFLGWFLVTGTWILCGVYIMLNNAIGDTCVAMEEWVANPSAKTSLSDILSCLDVNTTDKTLDQARKLTNETVTGINNIITSHFNGNSSQGMPAMCNPVEPDLSPSGCVTLTDAVKTVWLPYVCNSSKDQTCPLGGRLTPKIYDQLKKSVNVINSLNVDTPFLLDLANCQFVRQVFTTIRENHCHQLRRYSEWQYIGLSLISGGCMFSILLWVVFSRRRQHPTHTYTKSHEKNDQFMYRGTQQMQSKSV